jgi:hypothetical protein
MILFDVLPSIMIILKLTRVQFSRRKYSKAPTATARAHSTLPDPLTAKERGDRKEKEDGRRKDEKRGDEKGRRGGIYLSPVFTISI